MSKVNREKLVQLLPENFSDNTIQEVETLVESVIADRSAEIEKQLATRLNSFISENIESLKEVAIKELEAENDTLRQAKLFESIKQLVKDELVEDDVQQILESKDEEIAELKEAIVSLKDHIDDLENKNSALSESLESIRTETVELEGNEDNEQELQGVAHVVTESEESDVPADVIEEEVSDNEYLTADVLEWIKPKKTFSQYVKETN